MPTEAAPWAETKLMRGSTMRIIAHDAFPIADDGTRLPLPSDFVMGIGGASTTLLDLTPRGHVGRALDLGCGGGVQTLFLNADRIIATDIDERALGAANASCHLSGFRRLEPNVWRNGNSLIEFRQGSLLDPVEGQRFDLIVANPPFVIEGVGHVHRDSPLAGDGLTRELLTRLPEFLNTGGRAIVLASWLHPADGDWMERLLPWFRVQEASVWVAQREALDVDAYIEVWSADAGIPRADQLLWRARLDELGVERVGFGWIVLEKGPTRFALVEDVSEATRVPSGDEVEAQLRAFAFEPDALHLLQGRWQFLSDHWRGPLMLTAFEALLVERIRAGATLAEAVEALAAEHPVDADDLLTLGLLRLRRLVELGYFVPAP